MSSQPSDADALRALSVLRAWLGSGGSSATYYSQTDLPAGVSKDSFLRLHRARCDEGVEGWSRRGKVRLVTSGAWETELARETSRSRRRETSPTPANDPGQPSVDERLDAALGIKTRKTG